MPRQELIQELKIREKQLAEELEAIRIILKSYIPDYVIKDNTVNDNSQDISTTIKPKRKIGKPWPDYILYVLKEMGGKSKSRELSQAIIKANPNIKDTVIKSTVRHHLSRLLKEKQINAQKSEIKSEGYIFCIKE